MDLLIAFFQAYLIGFFIAGGIFALETATSLRDYLDAMRRAGTEMSVPMFVFLSAVFWPFTLPAFIKSLF